MLITRHGKYTRIQCRSPFAQGQAQAGNGKVSRFEFGLQSLPRHSQVRTVSQKNGEAHTELNKKVFE